MTNIDEIIVASLTGEASQEELASLREWRAADLRNEREYRARMDAWEVFGTLGKEGERRQPPSAYLLSRLAEEPSRDDGGTGVDPRKPETHRVSGLHGKWRRVGVAAAVILSLGVGAAIGNGVRLQSYGPRALVTGANEVATVTLTDQTIVRLAPGSRLEFPRGGEQREVSLTGRAYFAVTHVEGEPFRVRLATGMIEVLGTRFEVQSVDGGTRVAVVEGEVRMVAPGGRVRVNANEVARISARGQLDVERVDDVFQVVDWLGRFLAFESTPLIEVAGEFRERFNVDFDIADEVLSSRTVTGWFSDLTVEEMIRGICAVVEAECVIGDGTVRMESRSPEPTRVSIEPPTI